MVTEAGLIQSLGAYAVLFYWFLLCFSVFFLYFDIFSVKNQVFREILWIPFSSQIPWKSRKTGASNQQVESFTVPSSEHHIRVVPVTATG